MEYQSSQVSFSQVGPAEWASIADDVISLENRLFGGTELCEDLDSYGEMFTDPNVVAYVAWVDNKFAGFIVGIPSEKVTDCFIDDEGKLLYHFDEIGQKSLYISTIEVVPEFGGRGIGTRLTKMVVDEAKRLGYYTVSEHASTSTGAAHIIEKFNPSVRKICINYCDTGEDFLFYQINLK